jgi:protease IV
MPFRRSLSPWTTWLVMTILLVPISGLAGDGTVPFMDYRTESWFLTQSPSVMGGPAAALFNPAAWAINDKMGLDTWQILHGDDYKQNQYGTSFGRNVGFAMQTQNYRIDERNFRVFDYMVGLAGGDRRRTFGLAYRWSAGDTDRVARHRALSAGVVTRPNRWVSYGASGVMSVEADARQYMFDLGIRPFGRPWLSVFADWTANSDQAFFRSGVWGAGAEVRPYKGVHLGARAREMVGSSQVQYSLFLGLTLGGEQFAGLPLYDSGGDNLNTTLLQRSSPAIPGLTLPALHFGGKKNHYYPINLENRLLTYQKFRYFDDKNVAWLDLLKVLNRVRDSEDIDGVVLNLAGFRGRPSLIWEMRVKLEEIKAAGKQLIVHIDRPLPTTYYLASAADRISLDPWGNIALPGFALTRSYLKGSLEKLGIGFQEFRYFKYKSAMETYARSDMSDADREQRQRIVDVIYEELRRSITAERGMSAAEFDAVIDDLAILSPEEALKAGLVDVVGRWDEMSKWLNEERDAQFVSSRLKRLGRRYYDQEWGRPLRIPVVFAVGTCAMDSGIRGRATSAYLRRLVSDPSVVAVVLRADSPGGDPLPSDLVAGAVRQLKEAGKPVIISQGDVAASGGYWISMDGSEVLTTPLTITGSIGVIGGWVWDDGIAASAGITADGVQRGKHADLMSLVQFPLLGGLPRRAMDREELERVEKSITGNYDKFVAAVAEGRDLPVERVGEIAQGRVWMGGDAVEIGLCDRFGTLDDAIQLARKMAKIPDWRTTEVVEFPARPAFAVPSFFPSLPSLLGLGQVSDEWLEGYPIEGTSTKAVGAGPTALQQLANPIGLTAAEIQYLRTISSSPGNPLFMVSPDLLPQGWTGIEHRAKGNSK